MCPNQGDFGRGVTSLRKDSHVYVTSCNGEGYFVTCSARLVEVCEKSYWGRSWFSPRLGSRCFHVKIVCVLTSLFIFAVVHFLSTLQTVRPNKA